LPESAGLNGTKRDSAGFGRAEALGRVAVHRQPLTVRSPLPYFHNGFAATLDAVVAFYESKFGIVFTAQDRSDLLMFLRSL
jgi:cytochrome c peroxidase